MTPHRLFMSSLIGTVVMAGAAAVLWLSRPPSVIEITPPTIDAGPYKLPVLWNDIERAERFEKALPPELLARIRATQVKIDPTCSTQFNVTDIPASFSVVYKKAERDNAGMLTAPCTYLPGTVEIFYAGVHYPGPR